MLLVEDEKGRVRKRAKQKRAEKTRRQLLDAATDCFSDYGYEATSVRMIAERADISFQLISYHFGNKQELFRAVFDEIIEDAFSEARAALARIKETPIEHRKKAFRDYLKLTFGANIKKPTFRRLLTQESMADSQFYQKVMQPAMLELLKKFRGLIEEMMVSMEMTSGLDSRELMMLIPSIGESNALMQFELEQISGYKIDSEEFLEWQTNAVMKLLFKDE